MPKINPLTKKRATKDKYYVDPDQLKQEIINTQKQGSCTEGLAMMILDITRHVYGLPKYNRCSPEDKEEMVSFNIERWMKRGIYTISPDNNPFSYITHGTELNGYRWLQIKRQKQIKFDQYVLEKINDYAIEHGGMLPEYIQEQKEYLENEVSEYED